MIDPTNITNYNLTDEELEEHIIFWVFAAGKNGRTTARLLDRLLKNIHLVCVDFSQSPFYKLSRFDQQQMAELLKDHGFGCYNMKARSMYELVRSELDLKTCTADDLEGVHGIGMKTARCFIIHSRKGAQYAGLDTHILKFLKKEGYDVPKATPQRKKYLELEQIFLKIAEREKKLPADLDLEVWNAYSIK